MIWLISFLLMVVAIYFLSKGWQSRNYWQGQQTAKRDRDTALALTKLDNERAAQNKAGQNTGRKPQPIPHDGPSLLYADKNTSQQRLHNNEAQARADAQSANESVEDVNAAAENASNALQTASNINQATTASLVGAGAVAAATSATISAANSAQHEHAHVSTQENANANDDDFDQAVSDFDEQLEAMSDDETELGDLGDMTSDISEMLKILNMRETDSPRLDINEEEYRQLKTGKPGDVAPEKIGTVSDRLKTMLD